MGYSCYKKETASVTITKQKKKRKVETLLKANRILNSLT